MGLYLDRRTGKWGIDTRVPPTRTGKRVRRLEWVAGCRWFRLSSSLSRFLVRWGGPGYLSLPDGRGLTAHHG